MKGGSRNDTSFVKNKSDKVPCIPGTSVSIHNSLLITSTGIPDLDNVLGGGIPVGSVLLINDDPYRPGYAKILERLFLSRGVVHGHGSLCATSHEDDPEKFKKQILASLPDYSIDGDSSAKDDIDSDTEVLRIAWRYTKQRSSIARDKINSRFNLKCPLSNECIDLNKFHCWMPKKMSLFPENDIERSREHYRNLMKFIKHVIIGSRDDRYTITRCNETNQNTFSILRISIRDLGSLLWGNDICFTDLTSFLMVLRSLCRHHLIVCIVTLHPDNWDSSTLRRIYDVIDFAIEFTVFQEGDDMNKMFGKNYHGLLKICKAAKLNSISGMEMNRKFLFKSTKNKFSIEKIQLPPDLENGAVPKCGSNKEF